MKYLLVLCVIVSSLFLVLNTALAEDKQRTVQFSFKQRDFKVTCNISTIDETVKWEKDGSPIETKKDRFSFSKDSKNHVLKVEKVEENDSGNYTCTRIDKSGNTISSETIIVVSDVLLNVPAYINVVEGEKLRIVCNVKGKPMPHLTWKVDNGTYTEIYSESDGRIVIEDDNEKHVPNGVFRIDEVQMSDRGNYTCVGTNEVTGVEKTDSSYIRVKDKYAALWPFLGICAEVFVLCAIIFIYEKKRNKTELEESDTDQSPDQKNTPDHGKDSNLRHRQ